MQPSDLPAKFLRPFADNADAPYIRAIPDTTTDQAAASLEKGFPPDTFLPVGGGGAPPDGRDFNGILNQATAWAQWFSAGAPIAHDSDFAAAVGGYPKGAVIAATDFGSFWISTTDNNSTVPGAVGAAWLPFSPVAPYGTNTGTANALVTAIPAFPSTLRAGQMAYVLTTSANTASMTLALNSFPTKPIVDSLGYAIPAGFAQPAILGLQYDGVSWRIVSGSRAVCGSYSMANFSSQAVGNGVQTSLNIGASSTFVNVGSLNGATNIFTFARPGTYTVTFDAGGQIIVGGANRCSSILYLYRDGVTAAGGVSQDNFYVGATGTYPVGLNGSTAIFVQNPGTTLSLAGVIGADTNFTSATFTTVGLSIFPLN